MVGEFDPEVVDQWIREIEKIFRVMNYLEELKVTYAAYMLVGGVLVYFPNNARNQKELEFLRLYQGITTVNEYAIMFEYLSCSSNQSTFEEWRCHKFEEGLRCELKRVIIPMGI
ncbi:hypothetical protein CR513_23053, partial [Mucuna pruriens]